MTKTTDQKLDELLEILTFVKDNGATQESLDSFKLETENNFEKVENRFKEVDDNFSDLKTQLTSMQLELDDIKASLKKLEEKTQEDDNAQVKDIVNLKVRVEKLEKKIKQLQPS